MIDDQLILAVERLRDGVEELKANLRRKYKKQKAQVRSEDLKEAAAKVAEGWLVSLSQREDLAVAIGKDRAADLSVLFQRVLSASERSSQRAVYDKALNGILKDFKSDVVIPLKRARDQTGPKESKVAPEVEFARTAFLGHSFSTADEEVVTCVTECLEAIGIQVATGKKPKAGNISEKVKRRIDQQHLFVGLFTRGKKLSSEDAYAPSAWVIDEKAYANAMNKPLILLLEKGVDSIGGIHSMDYEYIEFSRKALHRLQLKLLQLFDISASGLSD